MKILKYDNFVSIKENKNLSDFEYLVIDFENTDELDDRNLDVYQLSEQVYTIAKNEGLNILSDKTLSGVVLDTLNDIAVGCLFISSENIFSFDIAIKKEYQNKGLSHILIKEALNEYSYLNSQHIDIYGKKMPMRVDVINPILANTLKTKYDFHIVKKISDSRVIMSKK